jgi:hypothetical protein
LGQPHGHTAVSEFSNEEKISKKENSKKKRKLVFEKFKI